MGALGLPAVVIPHFDNAEGGTHDTRYCYMGEARLTLLESMLPDDVFVLGVDEHTACVIDLDEGVVTVAGRGRVTVRRRGRMAHVGVGDTVAVSSLAGLAGQDTGARASAGVAIEATAEPALGRQATGPSPLLGEVARVRSEFYAALTGTDADGAVKAVLALDDLLRTWSRDSLQSDELDQARSALRSMVVRLGEAAEAGLRDPREVVAPFVEALLAARARARDGRNWAEADGLRDRLVELGVEIHDGPDSTSWELR